MLPKGYKKPSQYKAGGAKKKSSSPKPTNPSLWSRAKSLAKQKFDVYPSAYANGWAAKWYKENGGGWSGGSKKMAEGGPTSKPAKGDLGDPTKLSLTDKDKKLIQDSIRKAVPGISNYQVREIYDNFFADEDSIPYTLNLLNSGKLDETVKLVLGSRLAAKALSGEKPGFGDIVSTLSGAKGDIHTTLINMGVPPEKAVEYLKAQARQAGADEENLGYIDRLGGKGWLNPFNFFDYELPKYSFAPGGPLDTNPASSLTTADLLNSLDRVGRRTPIVNLQPAPVYPQGPSVGRLQDTMQSMDNIFMDEKGNPLVETDPRFPRDFVMNDMANYSSRVDPLTTAWSAATTSYLLSQYLGAETPQEMRDRGFRPNAAHYLYINDAFKTSQDPNYAYNAYKAKELPKNFEDVKIGDLFFRGYDETANKNFNGFEKLSEKNGYYPSHTDLVVDKGRDKDGEYVILAGGNVGNKFLHQKFYYKDVKKKYVGHMAQNEDRAFKSSAELPQSSFKPAEEVDPMIELMNFQRGPMDRETNASFANGGFIGTPTQMIDQAMMDNQMLQMGINPNDPYYSRLYRQGGYMNVLAAGGDVLAYGGPDDMLTRIDNGGTHEESSLGGVPMGPNALVEEGETVQKGVEQGTDFVFSERLPELGISPEMAEEYNLPKFMVGKSFAKASKLIEDKSNRTGDILDRNTKEVMLSRLREAQEEHKDLEFQSKLAELEDMYGRSSQEQAPQDPGQGMLMPKGLPGSPEEAMIQQMEMGQGMPQPQPSPEEIAMMQAGMPPQMYYGGPVAFAPGGPNERINNLLGYEKIAYSNGGPTQYLLDALGQNYTTPSGTPLGEGDIQDIAYRNYLKAQGLSDYEIDQQKYRGNLESTVQDFYGNASNTVTPQPTPEVPFTGESPYPGMPVISDQVDPATGTAPTVQVDPETSTASTAPTVTPRIPSGPGSGMGNLELDPLREATLDESLYPRSDEYMPPIPRIPLEADPYTQPGIQGNPDLRPPAPSMADYYENLLLAGTPFPFSNTGQILPIDDYQQQLYEDEISAADDKHLADALASLKKDPEGLKLENFSNPYKAQILADAGMKFLQGIKPIRERDAAGYMMVSDYDPYILPIEEQRKALANMSAGVKKALSRRVSNPGLYMALAGNINANEATETAKLFENKFNVEAADNVRIRELLREDQAANVRMKQLVNELNERDRQGKEQLLIEAANSFSNAYAGFSKEDFYAFMAKQYLENADMFEKTPSTAGGSDDGK